jgi:hypothetical protein
MINENVVAPAGATKEDVITNSIDVSGNKTIGGLMNPDEQYLSDVLVDCMEEATEAINKISEGIQATKYPTQDPLITESYFDEMYLFAIKTRFPQVNALGWNHPDDRYNFVEADMQMVRASIQWLKLNARPTKTIRDRYSSYYLKHVVEKSESGKISGGYVSNGSFIAAALLLGYQHKETSNGINCVFNMTFSPKMQRMMRGY